MLSGIAQGTQPIYSFYYRNGARKSQECLLKLTLGMTVQPALVSCRSFRRFRAHNFLPGRINI
jgi:hypothetical protein